MSFNMCTTIIFYFVGSLKCELLDMKNSCTSTDDEIEECISQDTDSEFNNCRKYRISTRSGDSSSYLPSYTSKSIYNNDKHHNIDNLTQSNTRAIIRRNTRKNEAFKREKTSIQLCEASLSSTPKKRGASTCRQRMKTKKVSRNSISFGKGTNNYSSNGSHLKEFSKNSTIALNSLSQIDRFSRFLFPLSFFLLNRFYRSIP